MADTSSSSTVTSGGSTAAAPATSKPVTSGATVSSGGSNSAPTNSESTTVSSGATVTSGSSSATTSGGTATTSGATVSSGSSSTSSGSTANSPASKAKVPTFPPAPTSEGYPVPADDLTDTTTFPQIPGPNNQVANAITYPPAYVIKDKGKLNTSPDIIARTKPTVLIPNGVTVVNIVARNGESGSLSLVTEGMTDKVTFQPQTNVQSTPPGVNISVDPLDGTLRFFVQMPYYDKSAQSGNPFPTTLSYRWTGATDSGTLATGTVKVNLSILPSLTHPQNYSGEYVTLQDPSYGSFYVTLDSSMNALVFNAYLQYMQSGDHYDMLDFIQKLCRFPCNEGIIRGVNLMLQQLQSLSVDLVVKGLTSFFENGGRPYDRDAFAAFVCLIHEADKVYIQRLPVSRIDAPEILRKTRCQRFVWFLQQQATMMNHR